MPQDDLALSDILSDFDELLLFHLATNCDPRISSSEALGDLVESNIICASEMIERLLCFSKLKVIYTCSYHQLLPLSHTNPYSLSKELFCKYPDSRGIANTPIYLFDSYGANDRQNKVVDVFIRQVFTEAPIVIFEDDIHINLSHAKDISYALSNYGHYTTNQCCIMRPETIRLNALGELLHCIIEKNLTSFGKAQPLTI